METSTISREPIDPIEAVDAIPMPETADADVQEVLVNVRAELAMQYAETYGGHGGDNFSS